MKLHELSPAPGSVTEAWRKGRGTGSGNGKTAGKAIGIEIAKKALEKGIETVVFDRGGYVYQGRVQELAEGAREGGLKF